MGGRTSRLRAINNISACSSERMVKISAELSKLSPKYNWVSVFLDHPVRWIGPDPPVCRHCSSASRCSDGRSSGGWASARHSARDMDASRRQEAGGRGRSGSDAIYHWVRSVRRRNHGQTAGQSHWSVHVSNNIITLNNRRRIYSQRLSAIMRRFNSVLTHESFVSADEELDL